MRFDYRPNPALPPLAWIAPLRVADGVCEVEHGVLVETHASFFIEGAWSGDFAEGRPDMSDVVFGGGAVARADGITFVPSTATTDYLFHHTDGGVSTVANSLPLLLAALGDALDPKYERYAEINNSVMAGIRAYERRIPTRRGHVSRLLHNNLVVTASGTSEVPKVDAPPFATYEAYASYLADRYARLAANARDGSRRAPLRIYTTQSRGYDSTAMNAIAARHGVDGVFTITAGQGGGSMADNPAELEVADDGHAIAAALGIGPVIELERRAFAKAFDDELYFHAAISECQDANLKEVSDRIEAPALLLTGTLGELWYTQSCWYDRHPETAGDDLRRGDLGTHGLTEIRLRAGYVQAALPYIGARRRQDILAITESAAMAPWRLLSAYDRPIPRRLGEEAGVAREAFGQVKIGSVVEFSVPQWPVGRALRERYLAALTRDGVLSGRQGALYGRVRRLNEMIWFAGPQRYRGIYYALRVVTKLLRREIARPVLWARLRGSLFCFAANECAAEYASALGRTAGRA
jgi:hypothetical protein